jgi:hypothetical protein
MLTEYQLLAWQDNGIHAEQRQGNNGVELMCNEESGVHVTEN